MSRPTLSSINHTYQPPRRSAVHQLVSLSLTVFCLLATASAQSRRIAGPTTTKSTTKVKSTRGSSKKNNTRPASGQDTNQQGESAGVLLRGESGVQQTTTEIMQAQLSAKPSSRPPLRPERQLPERDKPQDPAAQAVASTPDLGAAGNPPPNVLTPLIHTLSTNFTGATLADTGAFPPDSMGTVGPTQFIVFVNGRIRSFTKAGVADGVLNVDPDVFFASVMTPVSPPVVLNFTSDPQIRYDRFTARWYLSIIDVPCTAATCSTTAPNRWMVAVSDAASNGTISGSTVWTFFQFQADPGTNFCDYPSLGTDVNALYVGCNMFTSAGSFVGTNGYVVRKTSVLGAGPIVATAFANLAAGAGAGPESPRGVDNFDPTATEGYFVGPDNAVFGAVTFRRVSNPGTLTPTISANIVVAVSTTTSPNRVEHAGNTGGANGRLDSIDDRFFQAMIRNGRLWAAHNFRVSTAGVASTGAQNRNATRWYEFQNLTTTPTVVQSGTVFDNAATAAASRQYFIPSVVVTGQGHAVIGMTMAGTPVGATPVFVGRLAGDTLGTMAGPPTVAAVPFGTTTANYNPPSDPGGASGRRWGDYSFTVVDPLDDMTVWTIQEFNEALNAYSVRVGKLLAPPPATPVGGASVPFSQASVNATIVGTSSAGSGFYDPGTNLPSPARPFTHISVVVNGAGAPTVNSVTYTDPTHITLNLNTVGASSGNFTVTITNPDGQSITSGSGRANGGVSVGPTAAPATISGRITDPNGSGVGGATIGLSGGSSRTTITDNNGAYKFDNVDTDNFYSVTPSLPNYHFAPANRSFSLLANKADAVFTALPDAAAATNAIDTNEFFVRQQYLDFLGREPDQGGFNYWTDRLNQCGSDADCLRQRRIDVSAAFFQSQEFQETGSFLYRLYQGALGRQLSYLEFSADRSQVVGGPNLDASKTAFANAFVARTEFAQRYQANTTADSFVDALLQTLHDSASVDLAGERGNLIGKYNSGNSLEQSRAFVLRDLGDNAAFSAAAYNRSFVLMEYFGYLRRGVDQGGYDFWLNVLKNSDRGNYRGMVCSFITSTEYQRRFGSVVTRNNAACGR